MEFVLTAIALLMFTMLPRTMADDKDRFAYDDDINKCLFDYWPANVLSGKVACSDLQLCYSNDGLKNKKQGKDTEAQFVSCYNTQTLIPDFTAHVVNGNPPRPPRRTLTFHNDLGKYAKSKPQSSVTKDGDYRVEIQKDLGYPNFDSDSRKEQYVARGHLTPGTDFGTNEERILTFISTNIAPQWQLFNGGNWEQVEFAVRDYSEDSDNKLYIFTGTGGFGTTLDGHPVEVKLNQKVYAPKYYWKVVCDPEAPSPTGASSGGQSVIIMGLNSIGDISDKEVKSNWDPAILQKEKRGVLEMYSLQEAKAKTMSNFHVPSLGSSCNPDKRGTFLDKYLTKLK